jgi:hypothetical protein
VPAEPQHRCASATGVSSSLEELLDAPAQAQTVLQRARRVQGDALGPAVHCHQWRQAFPFCGDDFHRVARKRADALRALRVCRVVAQQLAVGLELHAAAAGGDDDGLRATLDVWPPGVDIGAHVPLRLVACGEVLTERATTAGTGDPNQGHADAVEQARHGRVDRRRQCRLHAAMQDEHRPGVPGRRPDASLAPARQLLRQGLRQQRARRASGGQGDTEQRARQQCLPQQPAAGALAGRPRGKVFDQVATDIGQPHIAHAGGAGGFARAAGEAAVEVQPRPGADCRTLEHLLDEVDSPTRTVEFVAKQLVGRTGRGAHPAMHAGAQDRLGLAPLRGIPDEIGEMGFHG